MHYDLIIHVDDNDKARLNLAFNNAANYRAALSGESFSIVMVANGPAVQLFTKDNAALAERGKKLMAEGLSIRLCRNAITTFNVPVSELWEGCKIVPAGVVEIVNLQRKGFAYLRP